MNIKSRLLEFIPKDCMLELDNVCKDVLIPDNNTKVDKMIGILSKYDVPFQELGPGTNRLAIYIDGYVFKIALDKDGKRDNLAEFSMAQELQPFVIKVYEYNGLMIVTEYVTVISKEEFMNSKDQIRQTLSFLAEGYLLGDVGSISKNFVNWGYRDDGSLVILDFAYIYRILGDEMSCKGVDKSGHVCTEMLEYDENFDKLICLRCRKTYTFHDIRRRISKEYEVRELNAIKQIAFKVTKANQDISVKNKAEEQEVEVELVDNDYGGNEDMSKKHNKYYEEYDREDDMNDYLAAMEFMKKEYDEEHHVCDYEEPEEVVEDCFDKVENTVSEKPKQLKTVLVKNRDELFSLTTDIVHNDDVVIACGNLPYTVVDETNLSNPNGYEPLFNRELSDQFMYDDKDDESDEDVDDDNEDSNLIGGSNLTDAEIEALDSESAIEKAAENVEEYVGDDDSDDEFMSDPEEEHLEEHDDSDDADKCEPVNILGAGVEFIDVDVNVEEPKKEPDSTVNHVNDDVLVLTDTEEHAEQLRKFLVADDGDDYDDSYDDMHEQASSDSKILKKKDFN